MIDDASSTSRFSTVCRPSNFSNPVRARFGSSLSFTTQFPSFASRGRKRNSASTAPVLEAAGKRLSVRVQEDIICEECRQIDFQKALYLYPSVLQNEKYGILVAHLRTRFTSVSLEDCTLCRLFVTVALGRSDTDDHSDYELRAYSVLRCTKTIAYYDFPDHLKARDLPTWPLSVQQ